MNPSPPFRGEREGPSPQGWEGEVDTIWTAGVSPAAAGTAAVRGERPGIPDLTPEAHGAASVTHA